MEVSAICFVRDYVELHFDGPVLRTLSAPFGLYGCQGWRFPEGNSPTVMRYYIGKTVDGFELFPDRLLALDFGEHRFAIPLDDESRVGPEAANAWAVISTPAECGRSRLRRNGQLRPGVGLARHPRTEGDPLIDAVETALRRTI